MSMSTLKLTRLLRLGSRGKDVRAVKRGLARAGHGTLAMSFNPLLGPLTVRNLKNYQRSVHLMADGVYGPDTHKQLIQWFDAFARKLYNDWEPSPDGEEERGDSLQLPINFQVTHQTAGLPGFPARDFFAKPNTVVLAPENGVVDKLSGHNPQEGGSPGGPYGFSIYLSSPSGRYFMTHFGSRQVALNERVRKGQRLGTVCDSAVSGRPNTSHIHQGKHVT
jgi:murein DD-endopeptidase MepM/ murein hydrolase activator NlpD